MFCSLLGELVIEKGPDELSTRITVHVSFAESCCSGSLMFSLARKWECILIFSCQNLCDAIV
jgi:hypothetical protein